MSELNFIRYDLRDHVATITLDRPPHNFVDAALLSDLADLLHALDKDPACRVVVLASGGRSFCAGADFSGVVGSGATIDTSSLYRHAMRLYETTKPIVAAVNGAAIGAGAGLALVADFRIGCPRTTISFNFNRLGFHPGFGTTYTLPRLVGPQIAAKLFFTGRRVKGDEAKELGLLDEVVDENAVLTRATELALEIAASAPLAVASTRLVLRGDLAEAVRAANQKEQAIQLEQFKTHDYREGIAAAQDRRVPAFIGA